MKYKVERETWQGCLTAYDPQPKHMIHGIVLTVHIGKTIFVRKEWISSNIEWNEAVIHVDAIEQFMTLRKNEALEFSLLLTQAAIVCNMLNEDDSLKEIEI